MAGRPGGRDRRGPRGAVDPRRPLLEYGLSSRDLVGLVGDLGRRTGRSLPPTFGYRHPTIAALVAAVTGSAPAAPAPGSAAPPADHPHEGLGEPIAVIGLGCRLPGGIDSPAAFWDLLDRGGEAIRPRPADRWTAAPHVLHALPRTGGFLDDVAGFDADFFGITPREADVMDPQQRLTLEVAWAALEHAGIPPATLRGTRTGVYMGVSASEYGLFTLADAGAVEPWSGTGAAASAVANRLSYTLDLRGPSMVVDTACSSSLVAVHHAVGALRRGEADLAIVGGVNVMLTAAVTGTFARSGVLAADGRCKAFDAAADGIGRGEGCGVVVLRRLADARARGDRVLAVVRGSATNSDGRSNGIMAPNPDAQTALLAEVYPAAEVDPATVDYVEAHGTGTPLGDPIEAGALGAVLGAGRGAGRPLLVGSVKTNLGHLEGAAGIVGMIKVVLSLAHGRIPPSLHYHAPNPLIDFTALGLRVAAEPTPWPRYSGYASAGVSAFGFGGSNAHVVLEEWPPAPRRPPAPDRPEVFALSAHTTDTLRDRAADLVDWLESAEGARAGTADLAATLAARRDHLPVRAAVVAADRVELAAALRAVAAGASAAGAVLGRAPRTGPLAGPVFVFSGFGSHWPGMGGELLDAEPAFAAEVARLEPLFAAEAGISLRAALSDTAPAPFATAACAQYGMQLALAGLWRAHGVHPAAVLGHSVGEVAAAVVAGVLDDAQGLRVVLARTALLADLDARGAGAMAAVELSDEEFAALAADHPGVGVAVHAAPRLLTVSGPAPEVARLVSRVEAGGGFAKPLRLGAAGHSASVEPYLPGLRAALDGLAPNPPEVRFYSSVGPDPARVGDADYWAANVRAPVRFTQAVAAALAEGHTRFVEVAAHPVALTAIEQTAAARPVVEPVVVVPTLRRGAALAEWLRAQATLHVHGDSAALARRYPPGPVLDLPGPAWRHRRHWAPARVPDDPAHPLLGAHVELPDDGRHLWQAALRAERLPWLSEQATGGPVVLPGSALLELALAAGRAVLGPRVVVADLVLGEDLIPGPRTTLTTELATSGALVVRSRAADGGWITHATATLSRDESPEAVVRGRVLPEGRPVDPGSPAPRGLTDVRATPGAAVGRVRLPTEAGGVGRFALHPALADACLQALPAAAAGLPGVRGGHVPTGFGRVRVIGDPALGTHCAATAVTAGPGALLGQVELLAADNTVLVEFADVRATALEPTTGPDAVERRWDPAPLPAPAPPGTGATWVLVDDVDATATATPGLPGLPAALDGDHVVRVPELPADLPADGVVVVAGPTELYRNPGRAEALVLTVARTAALLSTRPDPPRLWVATTGGATVPGAAPGEPGLACLRGLVRVLAFEHPDLRATLVDADSAAAVVAELRAGRDDDEVAWRGDRRLRARLATTAVPTDHGAPPVVRPGAYVVTGGLGDLGRRVARWLAERGATRVVLAGRVHRPEAEAVIAAARDLGAEVDVVLGDIAEPGFAATLLKHAQRDGVALRGVVHAAGVPADHPAAELTAADLAEVWRPKVLGGLRLHQATERLPLDWFVVFASLSGMVGAPGQTAHATANAWLDALVEARRATGLPAIALDWGAWSRDDGSRSDRPNAAFAEVSPEHGMAALAGALATDRSGLGIARLDVPRALALFPALAGRPYLSALTARVAPAPLPAADLAARPDPRAALVEHLAAGLSRLTGAEARSVDAAAPLTSLGVDSLLAMRLRAAVRQDFDVLLPVSLVLRGASLRELAEHLADELGLPGAGVVAARGVAPRDPTERWLAAVWTDALGSVPPGVHSGFHDLGGDEAAAARVHAALSARLARVPPVESLFARPTIAAQADLVRAELEGGGPGARPGPVTVLRAGGAKPPLALFHPAGGPTAVYQPLVAELPACHPVLGLERLEDEQTVEDKARRYADLLRERQPHGPYRLGGWSFGGFLAYEVARVLAERGERVDQLFLLDAIRPLRAADPARSALARFTRYAEHVERTYGVRLDLRAEVMSTMDEQAQVRFVMRRLAQVPGLGADALRHQHTSFVDAGVGERWRPRPYAGRVTLLRAREPHPLISALDPRYDRADDALGWDALCPDLTVVRVPGDHLSMMDPPRVRVLAGHLATALGTPARV
ncbi:SDR family NAD(P)-dependent oxidoreductase [Actinokineospora sp. G85]|uniref:SDR family NAD(P)-dependent oxidoreductase n=1 Tax=Actinokineospora sp. G85 TaxID=3406626 RepID=UPI003C75039F